MVQISGRMRGGWFPCDLDKRVPAPVVLKTDILVAAKKVMPVW